MKSWAGARARTAATSPPKFIYVYLLDVFSNLGEGGREVADRCHFSAEVEKQVDFEYVFKLGGKEGDGEVQGQS